MTTNVSSRLRGVFIVAAVLIVSLGIWLAYKPKQELIQGMSEADTIKVAAKVTARVKELTVREGDRVSAGQILFTLDSPEVAAKSQQARAVVSQAEAQVDKAQEGARKEQIRAAQAQFSGAKTQADLATATFKRLDNLFREGVIARQKRDEAKAFADGAQAQLRAAQAQLDEANAGARKQDVSAANAQLNQARGALAEVDAAQEELNGRAPIEGEVSKRLADMGEIVPAGYPVFTLTKTDEMWVSVYLRENQFHGLAVGQEWRGEIPALNAQEVFEVYFISPQADYATWRASGQSAGFDVKSFEVRLKPKQPIQHFRPGMSVLFSWP